MNQKNSVNILLLTLALGTYACSATNVVGSHNQRELNPTQLPQSQDQLIPPIHPVGTPNPNILSIHSNGEVPYVKPENLLFVEVIVDSGQKYIINQSNKGLSETITIDNEVSRIEYSNSETYTILHNDKYFKQLGNVFIYSGDDRQVVNENGDIVDLQYGATLLALIDGQSNIYFVVARTTFDTAYNPLVIVTGILSPTDVEKVKEDYIYQTPINSSK